jgi:hypothetical protein
VYDVKTTTQAQIDALKAYPNGMTQADVDRLTRRDISRAYVDALKESRDPKVRAKGVALEQALERSRAQGDPIEAQRRLGITIENAKIAYADLIKAGAKVIVTTSAGNGGQPVVVIKGPDFSDKKPARVHTHYHGDNATVADPAGSKAGTNYRISESFKQDPQTVWVLPESVARPKPRVEWPQRPDGAGRDGYYTANWDNVQSQVQTTADALKAARISDKGAKHIVSFHSRGGEALINIMRDQSGSGLRADRLELHDCLYGSQYSVAAWGKTANGKAAGRVVVYLGNLGAERANVIKPEFKTPPGAATPRFEVIDVKQKIAEMRKKDPKIEDKVNPVYEGPNKEKYVRGYDEVTNRRGEKVKVPVPWRQFDRDPHYRTTGQFLGTERGP